MDYLAVKDLKKTRELWQKLEEERELVITRDGRPSALIISVTPETVDDAQIEDLVRTSRRERGVS